jgi:hypothetical protein
MDDRPRRITLCHQTEADDPNPGRGRYVGTTADGRRFFITTPFRWRTFEDEFAGRDFVALYLWGADGEFQEARFEQVATRDEASSLPGNTLPAEAYEAGFRRMLDRLGPVTYGDVEVAPFVFDLGSVEFGLVSHPPEDDGDEWSVTAMPGNYMCFYPPWDGTYDT